MTTETAFIVNLQHEYLRDAHVRVAACLQALPDLAVDPDGVLRLHWQATHVLKGEAQMVGFPHLGSYFEEIEDGLGSVGRALAAADHDAAASQDAAASHDTAVSHDAAARDSGEREGVPGLDAPRRAPRPVGTHAAARLASALREACYGIEDYLRALEREYTDDAAILARVKESASALAAWTTSDDADWGMGDSVTDGPAPLAASPVQVPSLGDGIVFDPDVFSRHMGGSVSASEAADSPLATAPSVPVIAPAPVIASVPVNASDVSPRPLSTSAHAPSSASLPNDGDAPSEAPRQAGHDLFLVVTQDGLGYALPLGQIVEIVEARAWNPLPLPKRNILGVINLRGSVLPVCDFQGVVGRVASTPALGGTAPGTGGAASPRGKARCIVVVSVLGRRFGVPVQAVANVAEIPPASLTALGASGLVMGPGVVTHTALVEGRTMMVVDMGRIVA